MRSPRCVRNFFIETSVDGKKEDVKTGPKNLNGGFSTDIFIRENGEVSNEKKVEIFGKVIDGKLVLRIDIKGEFKIETVYEGLSQITIEMEQ